MEGLNSRQTRRAVKNRPSAPAPLSAGAGGLLPSLSLTVGASRFLQVRCKEAGAPKEVLSVGSEAIPPALEWGEVLLSIRATPINPADL